MKWRPLPLLLLLLLLSVCRAGRSEFRICAYSLQKFDSVKASNPQVMHTLTRILSRCNITLLQEVMDPDGKAIRSLLSSLNRYSDRETDRYENYDYKSVSSKSLGNSANNMQQYVFIYRSDTVSVLGQHQYQKKQSFIRAPLAVHFQSEKTALKKFVLVPLHSEPRQAVQEMDRLYDVFQEVSKKWNNTNVMFLGAFHAGCAYMNRHDKKKIRLYQTRFSWLISDQVDTTVTEDTSCAYDRIVVHGEPILWKLKPASATVFHFGKAFKISQTKMLEISDHYPVEFILKSSALFLQATPFLRLLFICTLVRFFFAAL